MSYLPFARKYRPQTLEELVGQAHVTATLARALTSKRVAQAYLFTGQRGVGKTSAARLLAKCLNCATGPTAAPCNACPSCQGIAAGNSLDVIEIDGASNRGIDEIRALRETVPFAPASGPFRIYIIDEVHMLTTEAFNALLKTLEEPPAHIKFVFATTAAHKVPPTILSRCQRFDFRRLEAGVIVGVLQRIAKAERLKVDEPALYAIARAAEGSLRDAEVILEQAVSFVEGPVREADVTELLGAVESEALSSWVHAIIERDRAKTLAILAQQLERGREPAQLLGGLLRSLRNLLMISSTQGAAGREELLGRLVDEPADRLAKLEEQAKRLTAHEWLLLVQMLSGAYELIRRSPLAQTVLELVLLKLATREDWRSIDEISRRLEQAAPPRADAARPPASVQPSREPAAPASQSQPVQAMAAAPEDLSAAWPAFLEKLASQKMSLAAYLAESKPLALEGGTLTVGLPGFALHQEVLSVPENRRLIQRLIGETCGRAITIEYATLPDAPDADAARPERAPAPPIVQDIVNLFNATVLEPPRAS